MIGHYFIVYFFVAFLVGIASLNKWTRSDVIASFIIGSVWPLYISLKLVSGLWMKNREA